MARSTKAAGEREEAIRELRKLLKPGTTVYTVLRSVSSSGMTRCIDLCVIRKGEPRWISGYVGRVLDLRRHPKKDGLTVSGCGMDMGFHVVYELSHALFPKGFVPAKAKPPMHGRNGTPAGELDNDGGYALRHRWM